MASPSSPNPDVEQPTLVFKGTVKKIRAAGIKTIKPDEHTAIVHVDQVLEAPPAFRHLAGSDITVKLAATAANKQALLFHAVGWIFGDSIAVRAVTQEPI